MVTGNGLLRIFWPSDAPRTKAPGTIVGWRNSELDLFVVSVLEDCEVGSYDSPGLCLYLIRRYSLATSKMPYGLASSSAIASIP